MAKKPIVCCPGSINPDLKLKTDVNKGIKTFFGRYFDDLGGKGCDTCCAIKNYVGNERKVYLVGAVGNDPWKKYVLKKLKNKKIETDFVFTKKGKTGLVLEYIFRNGEVDVGIEAGANMKLTKNDVLKAESIIKKSALVIGQIENPIQTLALSFKIAKENNIPTMLDPSVVPRDKNGKKILFNEILPKTDFLMPDRYEVEQLTGIKPKNRKNLVKAAKKLLKYCKILCITLGSKGVYVSDRKGYAVLPAFKVDAEDGGGVGDTFRGIFGYKTIEYCERNRCSLENIPFKALILSAKHASAASAIAISKLGTFETIPTKKEIEDFLRKNRK